MKQLLLDVNVILDLWFNRRAGANAALLVETKATWVSASSLPILEYIACIELKKAGAEGNEAKKIAKCLLLDLLQDVKVLSNFGHHMTKQAVMSADLEDAQIVMAASVLQGDVVIVSNDKNFNGLGLVSVKTPNEALVWFNEHAIKNPMDFIDLKTQQDILRPTIEKNIDTVLKHGRYIMGPEVAEVEGRLADYVDVKHAVGVASGTDALLIAMMALGIGQGDEVITTPFSFIATAETIVLLGAKPVFVDINPKTYNIDPNLIEAVITPKTKAIMPVSLYGQCADYDAINAIAEKYGLPVIEDGCQSFGATYKGKKSCGLTTIGCTSFFPSKPLGCYGDGGACFTNDDVLAKAMREIRVHGQDRRYHHPRIGINGRMDTLQAAILLAKLDNFDSEVEARSNIGQRYTELLERTVVVPYVEPFNRSVYAQYTVRVEGRDAMQQALKSSGVPTAVHYPVPLHQQECFQCLSQTGGSYPVAEKIAQEVMSLPMNPFLTDDEIQVVSNAISKTS